MISPVSHQYRMWHFTSMSPVSHQYLKSIAVYHQYPTSISWVY